MIILLCLLMLKKCLWPSHCHRELTPLIIMLMQLCLYQEYEFHHLVSSSFESPELELSEHLVSSIVVTPTVTVTVTVITIGLNPTRSIPEQISSTAQVPTNLFVFWQKSMVVALWCVYTKYVSFLTTSLPIFYLLFSSCTSLSISYFCFQQ